MLLNSHGLFSVHIFSCDLDNGNCVMRMNANDQLETFKTKSEREAKCLTRKSKQKKQILMSA